MCGIVGYSGMRKARDVLLGALSTLEYRGYDSAGITTAEVGGLVTVKSRGRLSELDSKLSREGISLEGRCGIGHTRWATHGAPSDVNAHPHVTDKLSLVHNGIIENYIELRRKLVMAGVVFVSQTDTEVAARLLDSLYHGNPLEAIAALCSRLCGSYAFVVMFADRPSEIYATRLGSPLIAAVQDGECFVASDATAVLGYTRCYYPVDEGDLVVLSADGMTVIGLDGTPRYPKMLVADRTAEQAQKGEYAHFMLKEIFEQPQALRDTITPRICGGLPSFATSDTVPDSFWEQFGRVTIVACGTAYHAAVVGKSVIEHLSRLPVEVDIASEFRYRSPILTDDTLVIVISQSGETADTLAALRLARSSSIVTLAIVNVYGSTMTREADHVILTHAGPEIAVASTKAYSVQLGIIYLVAIALGRASGKLGSDEARRLCNELLDAVQAVPQVLAQSDKIAHSIEKYRTAVDLFFLGRGLDYAVAMEGSLKLKEISYIHCEAYAAGELKHGTISLITDGVPVIAIATQGTLLPKMISNMQEVTGRGATLLLVCKEGMTGCEELCDSRIVLPCVADIFMPLVSVVAMQLVAYHTAVLRDCDVDKPRNLAKSVTVE